MTSPTQPRSLAALFPLLHRLPEPVQDAIGIILLLMIVIPGMASTLRISADIWQGDRQPHDYPGSPLKLASDLVGTGEPVQLGDDDDSAEPEK
tara:strand:+ start:116 stop:394 length:279 start_codon:yes stop_codon:yes gene_type:complete